MKKLNILSALAAVACVLLLSVLLGVTVLADDTSGTCGDGLAWSYANGTLTVSGVGEMDNYTVARPAPWSDIKESIRIVSIESGVSSVGSLSFSECENVISVKMADTVKKIGKQAFYGCPKLSMVTLSARLTRIGSGAFEKCESLQSIKLPVGLERIDDRAFYRCYSLRTVVVPESVTTFGIMIFNYCSGLVSAEILANISELPVRTFYGCEMLVDLTIGESIRSFGERSLYNCESLTKIYCRTTEENAEGLFSTLGSAMQGADNYLLVFAAKTGTSTSSSSTIEGNIITTDEITVSSSDNAAISTTVTSQVSVENFTVTTLASSVKLDAVLENESGWAELVEQIQSAVVSSDGTVKANVSINGVHEIKSEVLSPLAGENVSLKVDMQDGSSISIDCKQLDSEKLDASYELTHSTVRHTEFTEAQIDAFGEVECYQLSFSADSNISYSPRVYVGSMNAYACATLYQELEGDVIERVQAAIVDKNGYATFYLGRTRSNVKYFVAINVEGETHNSAVIPDELAVDLGEIESFEPIEYVETGERIFLGMNIAQYSYFIFGGIFLMFVVIGGVMAIFYRKKRLELYYRMKMEEND